MTVVAGGAVAAKLAEACLEIGSQLELTASVAAEGDHHLQDLHQHPGVLPEHPAAVVVVVVVVAAAAAAVVVVVAAAAVVVAAAS